MIDLIMDHETYERPNGSFLGGFYWVHPWGLADYEEEWGRKWIDGFDYKFVSSHPFYDKTGNTRPFGDMEELRSRRLNAANREADKTWNLLGFKIKEMIFDEAKSLSEQSDVDLKELAELLEDYNSEWE